MKFKRAHVFVGAAAVIILGWIVLPSLAGGQMDKNSSPISWEYMFIGDLKNGFGEVVGVSGQAMNEAGREGWEAVTVMGGSVLMKRPLSK